MAGAWTLRLREGDSVSRVALPSAQGDSVSRVALPSAQGDRYATPGMGIETLK